jgi:hypothetical protein
MRWETVLMFIGLAGADERPDTEIDIRTYRNFAPLVKYFIGAAVFLSIRMAFFSWPKLLSYRRAIIAIPSARDTGASQSRPMPAKP